MPRGWTSWSYESCCVCFCWRRGRQTSSCWAAEDEGKRQAREGTVVEGGQGPGGAQGSAFGRGACVRGMG